MKQKITWTKGGFTLIEVIVTIVVLAILAAMMVPYFGKSFILSSSPIFNLKKSLTLNQVMEKISVEYAKYPHWRPSTYYASGTTIIPPTGATCGCYYSANSSGTSAATQPLPWQKIIGVNNSNPDGPITWKCAAAAPTLAQLQTAIGTEGQNYTDTTTFGTTTTPCSYQVINNHFITFDATYTEQPCTSSTTCIDSTHYSAHYGRYLKVTIGFRSDDANRTAETLTTLFIQRCQQ